MMRDVIDGRLVAGGASANEPRSTEGRPPLMLVRGGGGGGGGDRRFCGSHVVVS